MNRPRPLPNKLPPQPKGVLTAFTSIGETPRLLYHWLRHYRSLDVDRCCVAVMDSDESFVREAERYCAAFGAESVNIGDEYRTPRHGEYVARNAMLTKLDPWDWVIWTDVDEFRTFPAHLGEIVRACREANIHAVSSTFLDRVSADGSLTDIELEPSIGEQYPIGCDLTQGVLGGCPRKIAIHRAWVRCNIGHHDSKNVSVGVPLGSKHQYVTHHFKWTKSLPERIRHRMIDRKGAFTNDGYLDECQRALSFLGPENRINLLDPRISARQVGAFTYPEKPYLGTL